MRVLVTGATSLLGAAVVSRLVERGDSVVVMQRRTSELGVDEVLGSVVDVEAVRKAVDGCDALVHLAARVGIAGDWKEFEATNVLGTEVVLSAGRDVGMSRVVFVSSPSVAHTGKALVGASAAPADPENVRGFYARSKALAEQVALGMNSNEMSVVAIRPHLVWGPGDTQLVGRIVDRSRSGRLAVVGTGAALIDTTYIDNAADSLVAALDRAPAVAGRAFVVSNGEPRTVRELVNRIVGAAGLEPPTLSVPYQLARTGGLAVEQIWERASRTDDPPMTSFLAEQLGTAHWFDQRVTREALQWAPKVSLAEGLRRLRDWFDLERESLLG